MKKANFLKILALTCVLGLTGLVACNQDDSSSSSSTPNQSESSSTIQSSISLNKAAVTLDLLEETTLLATLQNLEGDIVWTSSDTSVVTVNSEGKIQGLKEGAATVTATCGDYSASCAVTVASSGARAVLTVDGTTEDLSLLTGGTYALQPTFTYNGYTLTDATFTYSTQQTGIISVSEDGVITGLTAGEARITVTASWGVFTDYALVKVNVVSDTAIYCDVSQITLYSSAITGEISEKQLSASVKVNGQFVQSPTFTYEYDETLLSVSGEGVVKNIATENTQTTLTIEYQAGEELLSTVVTVNLVYVQIDKTSEFNDFRFVATQTNTASAFATCFADGSQVIKVFDKEDQTTNLMDADGNLIFGANQFGDREWIVYGNNGYACIVKGLLVTAEISTKEQFIQYFLMANPNTSTSAPSTTTVADTYYGGYFVLTNDINLDGFYALCKYPNYDSGNYPIPAEGAGFNGTLDGQGHTVYNFIVYSNRSSLFATVGTKGVIKNIGFIANSACRWVNGIVANKVFGTLENVFVAIDNSDYSDFAGDNFGTVCYATGGDAKLINVVAYMGGFVMNDYSANTHAFINWAYGGELTNCYAVYGENVKAVTKDGITNYSVDEYTTATYDYTGYDTNIWDISGGLPVMKSALTALQGEISTSAGDIVEFDDEILLSCTVNDNYYSLTASAGSFTANGNGAYTFVAGESLAGGTASITLKLFGRTIDELTLNIARRSQIQTLEGVEKYVQYTWNGSAYVVNSSDFTFDTGIATLNEATFSITNHAGVTTGITATVENGVVTISASTLASLAGSECVLNILESKGNYDLKYTKKFDIVTKEIATATQFNSTFIYAPNWQNFANTSKVASETYMDGLYRLTANIASGVCDYSQSKLPRYTGTDTGAADFGFNGIFDGQGYTIDKVYTAGNGASVFGTIGRNGVVKNVAFTNCNTCWWAGGIVAYDVYGTIDNVLVTLKDTPYQWGVYDHFGPICSSSRPGATISNCVTWSIARHNHVDSDMHSSFIRYEDGATLSNNYTVYGGSDGDTNVNYGIGRAYNGKTYTTSEIVVMTKDEVATTTFTGLNPEIWNVTAGQLPSFKKA